MSIRILYVVSCNAIGTCFLVWSLPCCLHIDNKPEHIIRALMFDQSALHLCQTYMTIQHSIIWNQVKISALEMVVLAHLYKALGDKGERYSDSV